MYESALCLELAASDLTFKRQVGVPLFYKGHFLAEHRPDLIVEDRVVVEVKAVTQLETVHSSQLLTYLKVTRLTVGLLLNFNTSALRHGIRRVVL